MGWLVSHPRGWRFGARGRWPQPRGSLLDGLRQEIVREESGYASAKPNPFSHLKKQNPCNYGPPMACLLSVQGRRRVPGPEHASPLKTSLAPVEAKGLVPYKNNRALPTSVSGHPGLQGLSWGPYSGSSGGRFPLLWLLFAQKSSPILQKGPRFLRYFEKKKGLKAPDFHPGPAKDWTMFRDPPHLGREAGDHWDGDQFFHRFLCRGFGVGAEGVFPEWEGG